MTTVTEIMNNYARDMAKVTRDCAVQIINGVVVHAEELGLETVPIAVLRQLADSINSLPDWTEEMMIYGNCRQCGATPCDHITELCEFCTVEMSDDEIDGDDAPEDLDALDPIIDDAWDYEPW